MSDLIDEEWTLISHGVEGFTYRFEPKYPKGEVLNVVFSILKMGCLWRNRQHFVIARYFLSKILKIRLCF